MARPARPAPPVLTFAALSWTSDGPRHYDDPTLEELTNVLGTYNLAIPATSFDLLKVRRRGPPDAPFIYVPRRGRGASSTTFTYERKSTKNVFCRCHPRNWPLHGGEGCQGPRFALVSPERDPLPYRMPKGLYDQRVRARRPGPPFIWTLEDGEQQDAVFERTLLLEEPDLPGQKELEPGDEDTDSAWLPGADKDRYHTTYFEGWRGPWADKLIAKLDKKRPLGQVTVTQWKVSCGVPQWAVVLKLKAKSMETYVPTMNYPDNPDMARMEAPPRCISQYKIEATVLRVLVSQQLIDNGELERLVIVPAYTDDTLTTTESEQPPSAGSIVYFN
ncbi:hypothetical protein FRB96_006859 [Tulasnella sp. 330]|nr:hypothetical protein FRB96_006859 [Tulasnella sp. 330]KAG8865671.1 hypothetical protein FRB98_005339 [Tulasnella sp. 332]